MKEYDNNLKGALWLKEASTGTKYLGGECEIDGVKYYVKAFKNNNKKAENHPDYNLVLEPKDKDAKQLKNLHTTTKSDPFKDFGDAIEIDENSDLPF